MGRIGLHMGAEVGLVRHPAYIRRWDVLSS